MEVTGLATAQAYADGMAAAYADSDAATERFVASLTSAGMTVDAAAEIPGQNGGALMIEAIQREEGGVQYRMDRRPPDADEDWSPGDIGDPFTTSPAGIRKAAALARTVSTRNR